MFESNLLNSAVDATWLACAIDTDGFISIKRQSTKATGRTYVVYLPQVGFGNNSKEIVEHFGNLIKAKPHKTSLIKPYTDRYHWNVYTTNTENILTLLQNCLPYLIVKKAKAEFIIKYCKFRLSNPGDHSMKSSRTNEDHDWWEEFGKLFPTQNRRTST